MCAPLVADLVLQALEPASIELSLKAAESLEAERDRLDRHHRQSLQGATYEADLARRRYQEVDPSNRLVAAELERGWEAALKVQRRREEALNRFRQQSPTELTDDERSLITAMANDVRNLWNNESTENIERQNLVRVLVDRIEVDAVTGTERLSITIHWSGGFTSHHESRRRVQSFDDLAGTHQPRSGAVQRRISTRSSGCATERRRLPTSEERHVYKDIHRSVDADASPPLSD